MDPTALTNLLSEAGPWALLVVSLMVGWLVPKWVHVDLKSDRDYWKAQFERSIQVAEKTVTVAEKVT